MKDGKIRIVIGWILVVIQIISLFGFSLSNMKLWNNANDANGYISSSPSDLNFMEWCTGFEIGNEKFTLSLKRIFSKDDYYPLTVTEKISIYIRESLGASNHGNSFSLFLFDLNILISYLFCGILGILLLIFGYRANERKSELESPIDIIDDKKTKAYKTTCIILLAIYPFLSFLANCLSLSPTLGLSWAVVLFFNSFVTTKTICWLFFLVFFIKFLGKKKSILFSSAIILFSLDSIWFFFDTIYGWSSMDSVSLDFWAFPTLIFGMFSLIKGVLYLICGIKLYLGQEKSRIKKLSMVSFLFTILDALVWPVLLSITYDPLFLSWVTILDLIFATIITIYILKIPYDKDATSCEFSTTDIPVINIQESMATPPLVEPNTDNLKANQSIESLDKEMQIINEQNDSTKTEEAASQELLFCRKCGVQLLSDSIYCNKCGTKIEQ